MPARMAVLILALTALLGAAATQPSDNPVPPASPNPDLTPDQVVRLQIGAMQKNDDPTSDAGITTAFRFASPQNRQTTGPLEKFIRMVKSPGYGVMINSKTAEFGDVHVVDNQARQLVRIVGGNGEAALFLFILSKQSDGDYKDCWMTDGVVRLRPEDLKPPVPPPAPKPGSNGDGQKVTA